MSQTKKGSTVPYDRDTAQVVRERLAFLRAFRPSGDIARDMEDLLIGIGAYDLLVFQQRSGRSLRALGTQLCMDMAREAVRLGREQIHPSSRYAQWTATRRRRYAQLMNLQSNVLHDILSGQPRFSERSLRIPVNDQHQLR